MAVVDLFSGDKWTASPYIRGSEGKLDFMEWILFHFYRRLLDGVLPWQSKNTAAAIPPKKKAKCSREKKKKGGRRRRRRTSGACVTWGRCHRGRRCSTERTALMEESRENKGGKFLFRNSKNIRVLWQQRSYSFLLLCSKRASICVGGLRARRLQAIYVIIVTRLHL